MQKMDGVLSIENIPVTYEVLSDAMFPCCKQLDVLQKKSSYNLEKIKREAEVTPNTTNQELHCNVQFIAKLDSFKVSALRTVKDGIQHCDSNEMPDIIEKDLIQLQHRLEDKIKNEFLLDSESLKAASKNSFSNFNSEVMVGEIVSPFKGNDSCVKNVSAILTIKNIRGDYLDYFKEDTTSETPVFREVSQEEDLQINNVTSNSNESECNENNIINKNILDTKVREQLYKPKTTHSEPGVFNSVTSVTELTSVVEIETTVVTKANVGKEVISRKNENKNSCTKKKFVSNLKKKRKVSSQNELAIFKSNLDQECPIKRSEIGRDLYGCVPKYTSNNSSFDKSVSSNTLLTPNEQSKKIIKCVKNWNSKYPWMTYANGIFACELCQDLACIFKLEKVSEIYFVSARLCLHQSSNNHKLAVKSFNKKFVACVVEFIRAYGLDFDSKKALYEALIKYIETALNIRATEKMLNELIQEANLRFQEMEMEAIMTAASGEISFVMDECRRILIARSFHSAGHPEEILIPIFFEDNCPYDNFLINSWKKFAYLKVVFCGNCPNCYMKSRTFTNNTLPLRYPKLVELVACLEKDPVINHYITFLKSVSIHFPSVAEKLSQWTNFDAFIFLKLRYSEKLDQFSYMEDILKIVSIFQRVVLRKCLLPFESFYINNLVSKLKGVLLDLSVSYINLFLSEVNQKCYYFGSYNVLDFEFLFKSHLLLNIANDPKTSLKFSKIFTLLKPNFPGTFPETLKTQLAQFGHFLHYQIPSFPLTLQSILWKFREDPSYVNRFNLVYKFYKMVALLPFFGATYEFSLFRASALFVTLTQKFGRLLALQILQIILVDKSKVFQFYEENSKHS